MLDKSEQDYAAENSFIFGILGPLLVHDGDGLYQINSERQRTLLALLLAHANQAVSLDYLADCLWDGPPSRSAQATLQSYIMRLRRTLGPTLAGRVSTSANGYTLELRPDELDAADFTRRARAGKRALDSGSWEIASRELGRALALWRGSPYADIPLDWLQRDEAARLIEERLIALEWKYDAELYLGHCGETIPELRRLTAEYPLRERLAAQFMLALSQAGRRSEALAAFDAIRHDLADELGLDPCVELAKLQMRILHDQPGIVLPLPLPLVDRPIRSRLA